MDNTYLHNSMLKSDGTNQSQRLLPALNPANIKIDGRGIKEILNFTYSLSKEINFFNLSDDPDGDWRNFFDLFIDPLTDEVTLSEDEILAILENKSDFEPHFALFLTFVKLFQLLQNDINAFTKSRLDFYYQKVLQLKPKAAVPDKVHLISELAKNLSNHKIPAGTQFKAAKNGNTTPIYKTDSEIVINQARIKSLKSIYFDSDNSYKIYSSEAADSSDGKGKPFTGTDIKWSAFGQSQMYKTDAQRNMEEAQLGFAFASPMLFLKEGKRVITLMLILKDNGAHINADISNGVRISLSGEKQWIAPGIFSAIVADVQINGQKYTRLTISCTLSPVDAAVVAYNQPALKEAYGTSWPVLKVCLKEGSYLYPYLHKIEDGVYTNNLEIESGTIEVAVTGVKDLAIQNNQSTLNPSKPFQPFGAAPAVGSAFYIGSNEVFGKKLSGLSLELLWNEVPAANLGDYYATYSESGDATWSNLIFTAAISILYQANWIKLNGDYSLFHPVIASQANKIDVTGQLKTAGGRAEPLDAVIARNGLVYGRNPSPVTTNPFGTQTHDGFIKLEITGPDNPPFPFKAFGHNEFPGIYAGRAIKKASDPSYTGTLPNPPHTPSMKSLSLNYTSFQTIDISDPNSPEQFFHVEPFGIAGTDPEKPFLFPQFRSDADGMPGQLFIGNFYLGIENLKPPQNINILFQAAEGSADNTIIIEDEDIQWCYLGANQWIPISNLQILSNTTRALQTPGIISFAIGDDAGSENTVMPSGLHWLRGSITKNPAGISQLIGVYTQAIQATFTSPEASEGYTDEQAGKPLPSYSIKELLVKDAAVKSISQPFNSFDGKAKEMDELFYARLSERLRHKKRSLTLWDYERMILDEFPAIFKVKCLTHTDFATDLAPGAIRAIVVPNLINRNSVDPLQPRTNLVTLQKIKEYISSYIPVFVGFEVGNPVYEKLLVDFKVGFITGKDPGYYGNLLNEEIKRFLSPWAYEEGQDITFGGKVYKSDILVFIENRDYVDFVNNFQLYHIFDGVDADGKGLGEMAIGIDFIIQGLFHPGIGEMGIGDDFVVGRPIEVAVASGPASILVSAPEHRVTVLKAGEYHCEGTEYAGIGYWSIGGGFVVP
jgi:hypothetical protein